MNTYNSAISHLIKHCGNLAENEKLLLIYDDTTAPLAELFHQQAKNITPNINKIKLPVAEFHGFDPGHNAAEKMKKSELIISLCKMSLAHSNARIEAAKEGARFLSMPLYTMDLLNDPCIMVDYKNEEKNVRLISDIFTNGKKVKVTSKAGTEIYLDIENRNGNYCPGFVKNPGDLGSPPDIEANISPIENKSEGIVVIDGSITCPELGLLTHPIILEIKNGLISGITGQNKHQVEILNSILGKLNNKRRVLAECGVGLNPLAKLTGVMLTDEGTKGCLHFGFGANHTVGGLNKVDFHLDFVFKTPSLYVDDVIIMNEGVLTHEI